MKTIYKIFSIIILVIATVFLIIYVFYDSLYIYYKTNISDERKNVYVINNEYAKTTNYNYVSLTNNFIAKDYNQLKNILYTIVNSGEDDFTFYCDFSYTTCTEDFNNIINNQDILSSINNFVHPYNSFTMITASNYNNEKINIVIEKKYTAGDINTINDKVDEIIKNNINNFMSNTEKVAIIHDYIINTSTYKDSDNINKYDKANDILINHVGICSAYTDAMSIFLYKFNIDNYKIASNNHIWNLVYINNNWLHLDLTYDDPVVSDGSTRLLKDMFLINTNKLKSLNSNIHTFDNTIYSEAK